MKYFALITTLFAFLAHGQNKPNYTDAQIVQILASTNSAEISLAEYAKKASSNAKVDRFAEKMIQDHTANRQALLSYAKSKKLSLETSNKNEDLKMRSEAKLTQLKELEGKLFDRAYIDMQVADHKDVLAELDSILIPASADPQLSSMLKSTKETVSLHLKHAEGLQASF